MLLGALLVAGCGDPPAPPLPPGGEVVAESHECPVSPQQCFDYEIVVSETALSSAALRRSQLVALEEAGWESREGVSVRQSAACSSDGDVFLSFATGPGELEDTRRALAGKPDGVLWSETLRRELRDVVDSGVSVLARTIEQGCG